MKLSFPSEFQFGAATAAYQVEGAWDSDGRGMSVWDKFVHTKGQIRNGHTGDIACDHYNRYKSDIDLMKELNLQAYRFSISWPRVFPDGRGKVNSKGIDFYSKLVDSLLEKGITPFATLFHWDLPYALEKSIGGFANRECSDFFAEYASLMAESLGDRIKHWITSNEPQDYAFNGYFTGEHAPGYKKPWKYLNVIHNQLLGHGKAVNAIKSHYSDAKVGISANLFHIPPLTDSPKDTEIAFLADQFVNRVILDPVFKKKYPEKLLKKLRYFKPGVRSGDMELISTGIDFLGINNYTAHSAFYKWYIPLLKGWLTESGIAECEFVKDGIQYTSMGWKVVPESIYQVIKLVQNDYSNPLVYITENGAAFNDVLQDGRIIDTKRTDFLKGYIEKVHQAVCEGANVRGYFVWSLLDNFEWSAGYDKRFGIVYVDHSTQKRIIKNSGYWYSDLAALQQRLPDTA